MEMFKEIVNLNIKKKLKRVNESKTEKFRPK